MPAETSQMKYKNQKHRSVIAIFTPLGNIINDVGRNSNGQLELCDFGS